MGVARRGHRLSRRHLWLASASAALACLIAVVGAPAYASPLAGPSVAYGHDAVVTGQQLPPYGRTFQLKHTWTGHAGATRICHYDFRRWSGGTRPYGGKLDWTESTTKTYAVDTVSTTQMHGGPNGAPGVYWYQVRAVDCAGHASAWVNDTGTPIYGFQAQYLSDTDPDWFQFDDTWYWQSDKSAVDGELHTTDVPGATVTAGLNACSDGPGDFGVVAETGPFGGMLGIYAGTQLIGKANLYSATVRSRQVVAAVRLGSSCDQADEQVRIVNLSSPDAPRQHVTFDGMAIGVDLQLANPH